MTARHLAAILSANIEGQSCLMAEDGPSATTPASRRSWRGWGWGTSRELSELA